MQGSEFGRKIEGSEFGREIDTDLLISCADSGCLLKVECDLEVVLECLEIRRIRILSRWVVDDLYLTKLVLGEKAWI